MTIAGTPVTNMRLRISSRASCAAIPISWPGTGMLVLKTSILTVSDSAAAFAITSAASISGAAS